MQHIYALVAQLDRVTGYEPVGRGFESLPAYQKAIRYLYLMAFLLFLGCRDSNPIIQKLTHHCTAVFERRNIWSIRYKLTWQFV